MREQNSSGAIDENSRSNGITTNSSTPSPSITSRFTGKGMISFGAASGWMTESGCGSKVSTVSEPSITLRWPTWTPSKLPMAIFRGRGAASLSCVTVMFISNARCASLLNHVAEEGSTTSVRSTPSIARAIAITWPSKRRLIGPSRPDEADRGRGS